MSGDYQIFGFVRFFQQEAHADAFMRGSIYMSPLSVFRKIEALKEEDDGRSDTNEAVSMWLQPHEIEMSLRIPGVGSIDHVERDMAAPTSFSEERYDHFYILCLYALYTTNLEIVNGKPHPTEGKIEQIHKENRFDPKCFKLGPYAVVMQALPFLQKMGKALHHRGYKARRELIHYYDDTTFSGEITGRNILFWKQMRFEYQREFRIAVEPKILGTTPLTIEIGDISDICGKMPSHTLNESLRFNFEAPAG